MCSFFRKNEHMGNKNILRQISKSIQSTSKGVILLGPRQVGKSTLIESFQPDLTIDLRHRGEGDRSSFLSRYSGAFIFSLRLSQG
jgi:predicted AAA+ superfamily ATPase